MENFSLMSEKKKPNKPRDFFFSVGFQPNSNSVLLDGPSCFQGWHISSHLFGSQIRTKLDL